MRESSNRRVSPALVISIVALVLAAGGTSLASAPAAFVAKTLGLNSKQKKETKSIADKEIGNKAPKLSVRFATSANVAVAASSATTAGSATNATNATNAANATNATFAANATNATHAGSADNLGGTAASAYQQYGATLPSGATETGEWGGGYTAAKASDLYRLTASFPIPLAAGLDAAHKIYVAGASATHCNGPGLADSGYLCVYQGFIENATTPISFNIINPEANGSQGTGAHGFGIVLGAIEAKLTSLGGSYAVTAP